MNAQLMFRGLTVKNGLKRKQGDKRWGSRREKNWVQSFILVRNLAN